MQKLSFGKNLFVNYYSSYSVCLIPDLSKISYMKYIYCIHGNIWFYHLYKYGEEVVMTHQN